MERRDKNQIVHSTRQISGNASNNFQRKFTLPHPSIKDGIISGSFKLNPFMRWILNPRQRRKFPNDTTPPGTNSILYTKLVKLLQQIFKKIQKFSYLGYEGTFDENPSTWMEVDDDARLDVERTHFFDMNHITNMVWTVCPGHELTVRHTWVEDGLTHRSMMAKNNKETRDGQQCGRRPLCEMKASRLHL